MGLFAQTLKAIMKMRNRFLAELKELMNSMKVVITF
jgi:hypothetical protein